MIAVVDDDPKVLESLAGLLESAGHAVRTFSSAKALLDAGLSGIACLVTDIGMPVMDGFDLLDAVKKDRPDLPVFLITGHSEASGRNRAFAKDIGGFFSKPVDGAALLAAIDKALRR